jgi:hypothetical protein
MFMLTTSSILAICCGLLCLHDAEFAWRLYEWDCELLGDQPRLRDPLRRVKQVGVLLVALGLVGVVASINLMS